MIQTLWRGLLVTLLAACSLQQQDSTPRVVFVTATYVPADAPIVPTELPPRVDLSPVPQQLTFQPTPNPVRFDPEQDAAEQHIIQAGDTLYGIAATYGVSLDSLLAVNDIEDPNALFVGQVIALPGIPTEQTPNLKLIPDIRLVRGPGIRDFDIAAFISQQPGYIRLARDEVDSRQADGSTVSRTLDAAAVVERVALEYSVDPRLLLALLEFRAGWLSNLNPTDTLKSHPMISPEDSAGVDREGLYRQLAWTADRLNLGYYSWKYRGWTTLELPGPIRLLYAPGLNAGTVALQYFLSLNSDVFRWQVDVGQEGFLRTYYAYFGDPFADALDPVVPSTLGQPPLTLPFAEGETWFYTGGAHGGWGSGSAWSAVDFAPPTEPPKGVLCYTADVPARAVAAGVIARSGEGSVVLDLDGDGDESTGWTILYLHLSNRVAEGERVEVGDVIGYPSCEGGFSSATHLHIARRFNGEWIPADCLVCAPQDARPIFDLGGWAVIALRNQEYQGFLERDGERRVAEQGRLTPENRISW